MKKSDLKMRSVQVSLALAGSWTDREAVFKVGSRVIQQGTAPVVLPQGAEVTAWARGRPVAIARVPAKASHVTLDENSTAEWMLELCRVHLSEDSRAEFASLVRQRLQEGYDVYQMMVHPDLFAWLAQRSDQPACGLMPAVSPLKGFPAKAGLFNEGWHVLPTTVSVFREVTS